jgi:hypothetical protein
MAIGEREAFGVGEIVGRRWCYNPAGVRERVLAGGNRDCNCDCEVIWVFGSDRSLVSIGRGRKLIHAERNEQLERSPSWLSTSFAIAKAVLVNQSV